MERGLVVGPVPGTGVAGALPRMSGNPLFLMAVPLGTVLLIVEENDLHSCQQGDLMRPFLDHALLHHGNS